MEHERHVIRRTKVPHRPSVSLRHVGSSPEAFGIAVFNFFVNPNGGLQPQGMIRTVTTLEGAPRPFGDQPLRELFLSLLPSRRCTVLSS